MPHTDTTPNHPPNHHKQTHTQPTHTRTHRYNNSHDTRFRLWLQSPHTGRYLRRHLAPFTALLPLLTVEIARHVFFLSPQAMAVLPFARAKAAALAYRRPQRQRAVYGTTSARTGRTCISRSQRCVAAPTANARPLWFALGGWAVKAAGARRAVVHG